jgi:hypothetical protein
VWKESQTFWRRKFRLFGEEKSDCRAGKSECVGNESQTLCGRSTCVGRNVNTVGESQTGRKVRLERKSEGSKPRFSAPPRLPTSINAHMRTHHAHTHLHAHTHAPRTHTHTTHTRLPRTHKRTHTHAPRTQVHARIHTNSHTYATQSRTFSRTGTCTYV